MCIAKGYVYAMNIQTLDYEIIANPSPISFDLTPLLEDMIKLPLVRVNYLNERDALSNLSYF